MPVFLHERGRNLLETFIIGGHDLSEKSRSLFLAQGRDGQRFIIDSLQDTRKCRKKGIVKLHDIPATTPVILQRLFMDFFGGKVGLYLFVQQLPVRVTETVDTLFHISYDQIIPAMCKALFDQRTEVVPLHSAGVLKLVYHIMVDMCTGFFIDERSIAAFNHLTEQFGRVGNQHHIFFFPISGYLAGHIGQDPQRIIITDNFTGGIIGSQITEQGNNSFDAIVQTILKGTSDDLPGTERNRFRETAVQIIRQTDKSSGRLFHLSLHQTVEKRQRRTAAPFKIGNFKPIFIQDRQAAFSQFFSGRFYRTDDAVQLVLVVFQRFLVLYIPADRFTESLIALLEDLTAQGHNIFTQVPFPSALYLILRKPEQPA